MTVKASINSAQILKMICTNFSVVQVFEGQQENSAPNNDFDSDFFWAVINFGAGHDLCIVLEFFGANVNG
jgi:hypothetical protein